MNRDETIALFERCEAARAAAKKAALAEGRSEDRAREIAHEAARAVWNGEWAEPLLAERKAMEDDGRWAAEKDDFGDREPQNDETRDWIARAAADFTRIHFLVRGVEGTEVNAGEVEQDSAPEEPPVKTLSVEDGAVNFSGFSFPGISRFAGATFSGDAWVQSATFYGVAWFESATFFGDAWFASATFSGDASFERATFSGFAWFESATFFGDAWFESATFSGDAWFASATFSGRAEFNSATFSGDASFDSATFSGDARFNSATFSGTASFITPIFSGRTSFGRTNFASSVWFPGAAFSGNVFFDQAVFGKDVSFTHAKFHWLITFDGARFHGPAEFYAIRGERGFSLAHVKFDAVPDFIQAHFEEAPRLDNVTVEGDLLAPPGPDDSENPPPWYIQQHRALQRRSYLYRRVTMADRDIPARWRALKRLAVEAHDQDREHDFFAQEIRSARFATDWFYPKPFFEAKGWLNFFRFVFGYAYGVTSNYGRSVLLPALWWFAGLVVAATFYFAEHRDALERLHVQEAIVVRPWSTIPSPFPEQSFIKSYWFDRDSGCYAPQGDLASETTPQTQVIGLSGKLRNQTDGVNEALQLALRDGFLILYGDADTAHRTYGCLYGVELYGGSTPVAIVPPQVGFWSAMHKLYSAVMIFLFGLALRNMLKMK